MPTSSSAHWIRPPGPVAPGLRIGLMGGSFNPAHEGHLHVSNTALDRLGLDYVWWLVSPQNPLKSKRGMSPFAQRLSQARRFVSDPRILVTGIEAEFGTRYTIDTLMRLKRRFPQARFVWLMGSDNLRDFSRWQRWPEIASLVPIAVVVRPGTTLAPLYAKMAQRFARRRLRTGTIADAHPPAFLVVDAPRTKTSATAIRQRR